MIDPIRADLIYHFIYMSKFSIIYSRFLYGIIIESNLEFQNYDIESEFLVEFELENESLGIDYTLIWN